MKTTLPDRSIGSIPELHSDLPAGEQSEVSSRPGETVAQHASAGSQVELALRAWLRNQREAGRKPSDAEVQRARATFERAQAAVAEDEAREKRLLKKSIRTAWEAAAQAGGYEPPGEDALEGITEQALVDRDYQAGTALADLRTRNFPHAWPAKHPSKASPPPCVRISRKDYAQLQRSIEARKKAMKKAGKRNPDPVVIPPWMMRSARVWQRDPVAALGTLGKANEDAANRIRRAATGNGRIRLSASRASAIVALGVLIWHLAPYEEAALARVLAGVPATILANLLQGPRGTSYSPNALRNRNHGRAGEIRHDVAGPLGGKVGDADTGNCGFLVALEQAEFLVYHQPRSTSVEDWQRGTTGMPCSQYKLVTSFESWRDPALVDTGPPGAGPPFPTRSTL